MLILQELQEITGDRAMPAIVRDSFLQHRSLEMVLIDDINSLAIVDR